MPWNLLILPLLARFAFIHRCHLFSFRSHSFESERLLLQSAVFGVGFAILGRAVVVVLGSTAFGNSLRLYLTVHAPFPYLGTALAAFAISLVGAELINHSARRFHFRTKLRSYLANQSENGLVRLIYECMNAETPIFVTLTSRKVYVGYVVKAPRSPHDHYFTIALLLSGYRRVESLEFIETENYTLRAFANVTEPATDAAAESVQPAPDLVEVAAEVGEPVSELVEAEVFPMLIDLNQIISAYPFDQPRFDALFAEKARPAAI